jgi:hypothetical protein
LTRLDDKPSPNMRRQISFVLRGRKNATAVFDNRPARIVGPLFLPRCTFLITAVLIEGGPPFRRGLHHWPCRRL